MSLTLDLHAVAAQEGSSPPARWMKVPLVLWSTSRNLFREISTRACRREIEYP